MIGGKIIIIRLTVTVVIVSATFALGWYLYGKFSRLSELGKEDIYEQTGEINNPRVDRVMMKKVMENMSLRKVYTGTEQIQRTTPEPDPFYK
jgi:hypothetical protein